MNRLGHFSLLAFIIFSLINCDSSKAIYGLYENENEQIRVYSYFSGCCGCNAVDVRAKIDPITEYQYFYHCDCGTGIEKWITTRYEDKTQKVEHYKSSKTEGTFSQHDSIIFNKIQPALGIGTDCETAKDSFAVVKGFVKQSETTEKRTKSIFDKKFRIGKVY
ncbi:hypothetical protein GYB22_01405 [bacterium]|nr:hypothetical protein [bacterium]